MKKLFLFCSLSVLFVTATSSVYALPDKTYKRIYRTAEDYLLEENFIAALPLYLQLDSLEKGNANVNFKIGLCYMNQGGFKIKAIPYLQEALKNVSEYYVEYSMKEKRAPLVTYSYLAKAYQLDYKFDEAIAMYEKYKEFLLTNSKYAFEVDDVNHEIECCKNGKELVANPVKFTLNNLGKAINSPFPEYSPVMSLDEKTLIFTSRRPLSTGGKKETNGMFYEDIYVSSFENDQWQKARPIGSAINTSGNEATVNLSADGRYLLIYRDDKGDGNLYQSEFNGTTWGQPKSLGVNINGTSWETHACFSADNNLLYFVSNKPGGVGGRDIYKCMRLPNGEWSPAQNLGPTINTEFDEDGVFIHPNGKEIYFSSKGHNSMGGFDIFSSKINDENGFWSTPVNMGYPVNSSDDDIFFVVSADGKRAYFSSDKKGGVGEKDIYMIDFREIMPEALTLLRGFVTLNGGSPAGGLANVEITATEVESGAIVQNVKPIPSTGKYIMILSSGLKGKTYKINCNAEGFEPVSFLMTVPPDSSYQEIERSLKLQFINFSTDTQPVKMDTVITASGEKKLVPVNAQGRLKAVAGTATASPNTVSGLVTANTLSDNKSDNKNAVVSDVTFGPFLFDTDMAVYRKEYNAEFERLLKYMLANSDVNAELSGYTDFVGKNAYNNNLSKRRAQYVFRKLVRNGVASQNISVKAFGESNPVAPNTTESGKANVEGMKQNRRVEVKIVKAVK